MAAMAIARSPSSNRLTSSMCSRICSFCAASPSTFVPTTARSSSPKPCNNGLQPLEQRPLTSHPAVRGRTALSRVSTHALRDELLNGEIFYTLREAEIVIESWRRHYNAVRPHTSIGYRAPAPEVFTPTFLAWPATQTPASYVGHAAAGAKTSPKLTFNPDHLVGAGQDARASPGA